MKRCHDYPVLQERESHNSMWWISMAAAAAVTGERIVTSKIRQSLNVRALLSSA